VSYACKWFLGALHVQELCHALPLQVLCFVGLQVVFRCSALARALFCWSCKWFLGALPSQVLCFVGPASGFWVLCPCKCSVLLVLQVVVGCSALASALFCWSCKWFLGALPLQELCFVGPASGVWVLCPCKCSVLRVLLYLTQDWLYRPGTLHKRLFCLTQDFSTLYKTGYTRPVHKTGYTRLLYLAQDWYTRLVHKTGYTRLVHKTGTQDWLHKIGTQDWLHNTFLSYTRLVHKTGHTILFYLTQDWYTRLVTQDWLRSLLADMPLTPTCKQ